MGAAMLPVIVQIIFFWHGLAVGTIPVASAMSETDCIGKVGAAAIAANKGKEPVIDGEAATPFILCIDTRPLAKLLEEAMKPAPKVQHKPGAVTL